MDQLPRQLAETALDGAYVQVSDAASGLDAGDFLLPGRCAGWAVTDVLYHQLLDARRALRTFASPATGAPDRVDVSYWRPFSADGDVPPGSAAAAEHARHVRIVASAFSPAELMWEWTETAGAARRAARACPHQLVTTQGHVLRTADFIGTLAVEAAVHYLDLTVEIPAAAAPDPISLGLVRRVLDGLLGESPTDGWDDLTYVLKGTGRLTLTETERARLGPAADRFPLFG
jgi:Mycothiol maleylpyruvate isomerase N-terminal domain